MTSDVGTAGGANNLFPALDAATEAALRASIIRFGVLVPVVRDQNGRTLDGFHRSRIADEEGVKYQVDVIHVADEDQAAEIQRTLNSDRRHMSIEQRREMVAALREQGHSLRAIAGAVGMSEGTVRTDLSTAQDYAVPERITGLDGKSRPAKRLTVIPAKDKREAERVQAALAELADTVLPNVPVLDVRRVERLAREHRSERLRAAPIEATTTEDDITILHGDFRDVTFTAAGAVIITDPPYPREFLPLWGDLARMGLGWGCDVLVAMSGQLMLPEVIAQISAARDQFTGDGWNYRWCGAYLTSGPATRVHAASVSTSWKPILMFDCTGAELRKSLTTDVFVSGGDDKAHHHWGQNEAGIAALVEAFTEPGDLVVDPFLGGGTTAVVCRDLGRRFVGCDVDAAAVSTARARLDA